MGLDITVCHQYHPQIFPQPKKVHSNHQSNAFDKMREQSIDGRQVNNVIKYIRAGLYITDAGERLADWKTLSPGLRETLRITNTMIDFFKVIEIFSHMRTLYNWSKKKITQLNSVNLKADHYERRLEIAGGSLGALASIATVIKITDRLGQFAKLSNALGYLRLFPFTSMLAALEVVRSSLTITLAAHRLKHINACLRKEKQKKELWSSQLNAEFAKGKIARIQTKMDSAGHVAKQLNNELKATGQKLEEMKSAYLAKQIARIDAHHEGKRANIFKHAFANLKNFHEKQSEKRTLRMLQSRYKSYNHRADILQHYVTLFNTLADKKSRWVTIQKKFTDNTLTESDYQALSNLAKSKLAKHKIKLMNWKNDKIKEGLTMMQHSAIITITTSVIILTALSLIALPIPTIYLSIIALMIITPSFVGYLYRAYKAPVKVTGVEVPDLITVKKS